MVLGLAAAYLLSRVPLLRMGYGSESDAWSLALVGRFWAATGEYRMSRRPGHPVTEAISAVLARVSLPPAAWPAVTTVASLVALILLAHVMTRLGQPARRVALALGVLAVHPLFWTQSASATDYVPASMFLVGAVVALLHRRAALAGVLGALATGARPEMAGAALPLVWLSWDPADEGRRRQVVALLLSWGVATLTLYLPVLATYGMPTRVTYLPSDWSISHRTLLTLARVNGLSGTLGTLAAVAVAATLVWRRERPGRPVTALLLLAAYPFAVLFWHPTKTEILLPSLVLGVAAVTCLRVPGRLLVAYGAFSLLYGFAQLDLADRVGGRLRPVVRVEPGVFAREARGRREMLEAYSALAGAPIPARSVLITGFRHSRLVHGALCQQGDLRLVHPELMGIDDVEATLLYAPGRDLYLSAFAGESATGLVREGYHPYVLAEVEGAYSSSSLLAGATPVRLAGAQPAGPTPAGILHEIRFAWEVGGAAACPDFRPR